MNRRDFIGGLGAAATLSLTNIRAEESLAQRKRGPKDRGYYLCFMRMPTFNRATWIEIIDELHRDGINHIILWMGGAFRSKKFPITWQWAKEHGNVREDFARSLIDHAHSRGIQVLLGFTPFGYDGVNQFPIEYPQLRATGADGKPVQAFGIGCWGWNLCPAQEQSQRLMKEYAREMLFDFYPNADGLFIESSDYAICHCKECGPKFFDHEFKFVKEISEETWKHNSAAKVVVYPHYFSGAKLRFSFGEGRAAKLPFDSRWTLFFTPHSAAIEPELISRAKGAWWWNEAPARFDIPNIGAGVRKALAAKCSGYIPSLECYSYVTSREEFGEPWLVGKRQVPFGFGWLREGENPYKELPVRAVRMIFREVTTDPTISEEELEERLARELFGNAKERAAVKDLFRLIVIFNTDRDWSIPGALTSPDMVVDRHARGKLTPQKRSLLKTQLATVRELRERYSGRLQAGMAELGKIASWLADQWTTDKENILS
jgi:hypothetical protein